MNQPLISIIITVLNGEKTIQDCLNSISGQTLLNFEVIIIDGGSVDHTMSIINNSAVVNKTVRVLPGIGLYAGLNKGVDLATGQWFYFMGSDDELYDIDTLRTVATILTSKPVNFEVLVGNVHYVKQEFVFRPQLGSPYWVRYKVHHQGMFYSHVIFDNLKYSENLAISADYELNLKLALAKVPHQHIDMIICTIGENGISNTQIKRSSEEIHKIHQDLFSGIARLWVVNYFRFQRQILLTRRRYGLVNLKLRIGRFVKSQLSFSKR